MRPLQSLAGAALCALALSALAACDPKPKPPEPQTGSTAATSSASPMTGVTPHDTDDKSAAERPGAVATGAIEAGQAGHTPAATGAQPAPTGGDGVASASAPASR